MSLYKTFVGIVPSGTCTNFLAEVLHGLQSLSLKHALDFDWNCTTDDLQFTYYINKSLLFLAYRFEQTFEEVTDTFRPYQIRITEQSYLCKKIVSILNNNSLPNSFPSQKSDASNVRSSYKRSLPFDIETLNSSFEPSLRKHAKEVHKVVIRCNYLIF